MHLCYVDESGSTGLDLESAQQPVFVIAGLLVSDEKWRRTERAVIERIETAFDGPLPSGFELHAADLLSPDGQSWFGGWERDRRSNLAFSLLDLVEERSHQVLAQVIHKPRMAAATPPTRAYGFDWKNPWDVGLAASLTMFEEYLRGPRTGRSSTGMMFIDHEPQYLDLVRERTRDRRAAGGWRELRKVMEIGYSAVSHANPMIQLVDLIAFALRKAAEVDAGYGAAWPEQARDFYVACRERVWPRVEFKMLRFSRLNVPADLVDYLKEIRRLP